MLHVLHLLVRQKNGNHPMFDLVRKFARYDTGSPKVFYAFNNIILTPVNKDHPTIPMTTNLIEDMMYSGLLSFLVHWTSFLYRNTSCSFQC